MAVSLLVSLQLQTEVKRLPSKDTNSYTLACDDTVCFLALSLSLSLYLSRILFAPF